jgi:DNA-binding transcriptional LysR family regulator
MVMSEVHLWDLDLNLLVVLDVLLRERSVTRAAARLGRTQSAISHALNRLRETLGDELLIRDGHAMRPTARGEALAETLPRALDLLRRTLADAGPFEPATCERTLRLAAPDFLGGALPELLTAVAAAAPRVRVELVAVGEGAFGDLAEGRYDLLVAPPLTGERGPVQHELLGVSAWRVFGRPDHPAFVSWSAEAWVRWPHLQIRTIGANPGPVDRACATAGLRRVIGAVVPHFATAPAILSRTDLLLTVPRVALHGLAAPFGLAERPVPLELAPMPLALHWSAVLGGEPAVAWFRGRVEQVLRTILAAGPPIVRTGGAPR